MRWPAVVTEWGSTSAERGDSFPCDALVPDPYMEAHRAVDVKASAEMTFRWLCQMRVAPYSYDWIDNRGRRSPQELTPGLEDLEVGQRVMSIFRLVDFEQNRHMTLLSKGKLFGRVACTYRVDSAGDSSRLVVKIVAGSAATGPRGRFARLLLAPGDLVMMRRQLLNLAELAETSARG